MRLLRSVVVLALLASLPSVRGLGGADSAVGLRPASHRGTHAGPKLTIDAGKVGRRISPLIYGVNFGSAALLQSLGAR